MARAARMSPMCSFTQDRLPCRVSIRLVGARSSWEMISMGWVRHRVILHLFPLLRYLAPVLELALDFMSERTA